MAKSTLRTVCCYLCIAFVIAAVIIGIIIAVFAANFKVPSYTLNSLKVDPNRPPSFSAANGGQLQTGWIASLTVQNDNSLDIFISQADTQISLQNQPNSQFGTGSVTNLNLPKNGAVVDFVVPVIISLTTQQATVWETFLNSCRPGGPQLPLQFKIDPSVKVMGFGPFKIPAITVNNNAACPFDLNSAIGNIVAP